MAEAEDPRIAIVRTHFGDHDYSMGVEDIEDMLAKLDAAPKSLEPLGPCSEHLIDDRCPECVPQEGGAL